MNTELRYKEGTIFCPVCGNKTSIVNDVGFNTKTGEPETKVVCTNLNTCESGCYMNGGHYFKKKPHKNIFTGVFFGNDRVCTRCKLIEPHYGY